MELLMVRRITHNHSKSDRLFKWFIILYKQILYKQTNTKSGRKVPFACFTMRSQTRFIPWDRMLCGL